MVIVTANQPAKSAGKEMRNLSNIKPTIIPSRLCRTGAPDLVV
jgi:hypothetical protein